MPHFPTTQFMDAPDSRPHDAGRPKAARGRQAVAAGPRTPSPPEDTTHTALSSLSPSLLQDLMRFDLEGSAQRELLEVLAACLRHTQPLAIAVAMPRQMLTLTVFPLDRLVHCPVPLAEFLDDDLRSLQVLQVQPARLRPPGSAELTRVASAALYSPLGPLLWGVALQGARNALLPEIAGPAVYRVAPGLDIAGLPATGALVAAIQRLARQTASLRELSDWPGLDRERAIRLLNALYLQSGLIVSRTHPAATNEGWTGY